MLRRERQIAARVAGLILIYQVCEEMKARLFHFGTYDELAELWDEFDDAQQEAKAGIYELIGSLFYR